jgi:hypothetical protein
VKNESALLAEEKDQLRRILEEREKFLKESREKITTEYLAKKSQKKKVTMKRIDFPGPFSKQTVPLDYLLFFNVDMLNSRTTSRASREADDLQVLEVPIGVSIR